MQQPMLMPSPLVHTLTRLTGLCFAVLGALLFVAPGWSAAQFPWDQYPFVAMTMGGWYLGGAAFAWETARLRRWDLTYPCHLYLWSFSVLQAAVLVAFRGDLELDAALASPYAITLGVGLLTAVAGVRDLVRAGRVLRPTGDPVPGWLRALTVAFVLFVAFLALPLLAGLSRGALVWGEPLEPITAHAFGAFYLALVMATLPLTWAQDLAPFRGILRAGLALTGLLFGAGVIHHGAFNFQARPAGLLYFAAYLIVGCGSAAILRVLRTRWYRGGDRVLSLS